MIFDGFDNYSMAQANAELAQLQYRGHGQLSNMLVKIRDLDHPYFMRLSRETYQRCLEVEGWVD